MCLVFAHSLFIYLFVCLFVFFLSGRRGAKSFKCWDSKVLTPESVHPLVPPVYTATFKSGPSTFHNNGMFAVKRGALWPQCHALNSLGWGWLFTNHVPEQSRWRRPRPGQKPSCFHIPCQKKCRKNKVTSLMFDCSLAPLHNQLSKILKKKNA